jgi:hypothetical protein
LLVGNNIICAKQRTSIERNNIEKPNGANKYAGKPTFENIFSKFVIGTNDKAISAKDSAQLVANISKLPEVVGCNYSPSKHSLVVRCKKTDETNNFIIKIKGEVVPFGVFIMKNEEIVYTTKK